MVDVGATEEEVLYSNNLGKRSFQWELWQCCNNLCSFCYIGKDNKRTDKERQLKSLQDLKLALSELDFDEYNNISLIGGEFFQGQLADEDVRRNFFEIITTIAHLYASKKIGSIWISATLTIGNQEDLYEMIEIFNKAGVRPHPDYGSSGLWICTSWDAEGRFHSDKARENWEFHMKNLRERYPWVKKNTTIILMQKMCEMYISGEYSPHKFMEEFDTALFYKTPGLTQQSYYGVDDLPDMLVCAEEGRIPEYMTKIKKKLQKEIGFQFFPDRRTFRAFLLKYAKEDADTYDKLFNVTYRADELYRNYNDVQDSCELDRNKYSNFESNERYECIINPECRIETFNKKHTTMYANYSDCNTCMMCDKNQIWESVKKFKSNADI